MALIFDRERPFLSWNLHNPLRAPHDAARVTVFFEATILVVMLITTVGNIAPWSTHSRLVAGAFLVHYLGMIFFHIVSPYSAAVPSLVANVMRNRVLAPAHAWLYFLNLSRFGVDRRGHFRAVGETTTADLVSYKEKQREAKEEVMQKQVRRCRRLLPHPTVMPGWLCTTSCGSCEGHCTVSDSAPQAGSVGQSRAARAASSCHDTWHAFAATGNRIVCVPSRQRSCCHSGSGLFLNLCLQQAHGLFGWLVRSELCATTVCGIAAATLASALPVAIIFHVWCHTALLSASGCFAWHCRLEPAS